jgi:hypothetical protein
MASQEDEIVFSFACSPVPLRDRNGRISTLPRGIFGNDIGLGKKSMPYLSHHQVGVTPARIPLVYRQVR